MQRLRRYLIENPQEQDEIFAYNESYVFFRLLEEGPAGQSRSAGYTRQIRSPPMRGFFPKARWLSS